LKQDVGEKAIRLKLLQGRRKDGTPQIGFGAMKQYSIVIAGALTLGSAPPSASDARGQVYDRPGPYHTETYEYGQPYNPAPRTRVYREYDPYTGQRGERRITSGPYGQTIEKRFVEPGRYGPTVREYFIAPSGRMMVRRTFTNPDGSKRVVVDNYR
jgi:hypothetical protein